MKTEAEILQIYKNHAAGKNLSVSEITMQKRAATLAALSLEDEALFQSLIDADLNFFEVMHDNIRHERSVQKRQTEEELKKQNPTSNSDEPKTTQGGDTSISPEMLSIIQELKGEIESFKSKELVSQKRSEIEKLLFSKGVDKKDKELISELMALQSISKETDINSVADTIINIYNKIKVSPKGGDNPRKPEGEELDKMIEQAVSEIRKIDY